MTIGYEGVAVVDFLLCLERAKVAEIIDVRQRASSRRRGFSKTSLSQALHSAGIGYRHLPALGTPVELRRRLADTRDYPKFFECFARHLATRQQDIEALGNSVTGRAALLCYERDCTRCHRSLVAAALSKTIGASVVHLLPELPLSD